MTTELDTNTLEWAAQWLEGSIKGESDKRVREFAGNMAMTFRAAKSATTPVTSDAVWKAAAEILQSLHINPTDLDNQDDLQELVTIISRYLPVPVEDDLTDLQRAIIDHDNEMARLDRNKL